MHRYTMFGLDEKGVVVVAEHRAAPSPDDAIQDARRHLKRCHRIEVWSQSVCIHRETRSESA